MKVEDHLQIPYTRKEIAFRKWRESGYRDHSAYTDYIYWFEVCQGWRINNYDKT
jgi:hypothetical protein